MEGRGRRACLTHLGPETSRRMFEPFQDLCVFVEQPRTWNMGLEGICAVPMVLTVCVHMYVLMWEPENNLRVSH